MRYSVLYEKIHEPGFEGWYYAHIPAFDLTTHGLGIDGARAAAEDALDVWIRAKIDDGETIPSPDDDALLGTVEVHIEVPSHAVQIA
ncbi:MAG TPA: type II toxin-antitoxin system HicB family antitoxin [Candidatus Kapabacteria bacterium]|jgi:predicted RNase H-like HicB family nuclease